MGRLIDVDALKQSLRMGEDCEKCETDWKSCQYDMVYSKMDFCGWIDDAPTIQPIVKIADNVYLSDTMPQHDKEKIMDMADKEAIERMAEFIYENHLYQREVIQEPECIRLAYRLDVVKMGDDV